MLRARVIKANKMRGELTGFTLLEVLMIVAIMAIVAAIAVPMLSTAGDIQLEAAANMIATDLEYAKSMAISRGQIYSVVFDAAGDSYQIENSGGNVIDHPVNVGTKYVVDFTADSRLEQVNITNLNFSGGSEVGFDSMGSPQDSTGTALSSNGKVTLTGGGETKKVIVEPVTGHVRITTVN